MLIGVVSAILITAAGVAGLGLLRVKRGSIELGLAAPTGIALLAVLATWAVPLRVPEVGTGIVLLVVCLSGLALGLADFVRRGGARWLLDNGFGTSMLLCALAVTVAVLAPTVFVQAGVPDYSYDGPAHSELVEALRHGVRIAAYNWYPIGFHAPAAAFLALVPAVDSAAGAVGWGLALTLLAPLALFGFGLSIWRDLRVAAAGALLLALTSAYPYGAQVYSFWPMAAGLLLVLGVWTACLEYLTRPTLPPVLLTGLFGGALLLTHGSEVYTVGIGLTAIAAANWRRVASWRVVGHVGLAVALALALAIPYVSTLLGWAADGGTAASGASLYDLRHTFSRNVPLEEAVFWAGAVSSGVVVDLPVRLALLALGAWVTFRERAGQMLVPLTAVFSVFVALSRYVDAGPLRAVYAFTLPWAVDDRLVMVVPLLVAPLSGLGLVRMTDALRARGCSEPGNRIAWLSWRRVARWGLAVGLAGGVASLALLIAVFSLQTGKIVTYSSDDAMAMAWLRQHADPGDVLMNDGAADAGIWATYKGHVTIALPHTSAASPDGPELLVRANLGQLDVRPDVRAAACELGVRYVYRGAANSTSEYREFPELDTLRQSHALEEVFSSGEASIFRTLLDCGL